MYRFDFHTNIQSIFVGSNTINVDSEWYCDFNPTDETHHIYLYNLNKVRKVISNSIMIRSIIIVLASFFLCCAISLLRLKKESIMIMNSVLIGNKNIKLDVFIIEVLYLILPILLIISLLAWNYYRLIMLSLIISLVMSFLLNLLVYLTYFRRSHKYE